VAQVKDRRVFIVDRKKELIKYKGLQIAPAELEALLISHPLIADAAVIGVQIDDGNEVPRAYVVADKSQVSSSEILEFVAAKVGPYKKLRGGVFYLDVIPHTPSGKILRKVLRELAAKELGASKLKL
jgi:4-coumarate--CoA ligase